MFNVVRRDVVLRNLLSKKRLGTQQTCGVRTARKSQTKQFEDNEDFVVDVVNRQKNEKNVHRPYKDFAYNRLQHQIPLSLVNMKFKRQIREETPRVYPSLQQRLFELDPQNHDPELYRKVNIGMSYKKNKSVREIQAEQKQHMRALKQDSELVWRANHNELEVDLTAVQADSATSDGPGQVRRWAEHCGVYRDLFGAFAYFDPLVPLSVTYDYSDEEVSRVHTGNILKPAETRSTPEVTFPTQPDQLWTLLLTNPDGDLYRENSECCHWLVTNIRGCDLSTGTTLVPYMPPCPPKGVGYQRLVFVLFQQDSQIEHALPLSDPYSLPERSWSTEDFYRQHQAAITPAGLRWFQSDWDQTCSHYFHNTLGMLEPVFSYDFPKPYVAPIEEFPELENFVSYTDLGKSEAELEEMELLERLKRVDPFLPEAPPLPFPGAVFIDPRLPSWSRQRHADQREGLYRAKKQRRNEYPSEATDDELRRSATLEVEKGYTADHLEVREKVYLGVKRRKVLADEAFRRSEERRLAEVPLADLRRKTLGELE